MALGSYDQISGLFGGVSGRPFAAQGLAAQGLGLEQQSAITQADMMALTTQPQMVVNRYHSKMHRDVVEKHDRAMADKYYGFTVEVMPDKLRGMQGVDITPDSMSRSLKLRVRAYVVEHFGGRRRFEQMLYEAQRESPRYKQPRYTDPAPKKDGYDCDMGTTVILAAAAKMEKATGGTGILWELRKEVNGWLGSTLKELKKPLDIPALL